MMASSSLDLSNQDHELHCSIISPSPIVPIHWSQPLLLNYNEFNSNGNELILSSQREPPTPSPSLSSLIVQDLGFQATAPDNNLLHELHYLSKIKQETINEQYQMIDEKLLLRALHNSSLPVSATAGDFRVPNNNSSFIEELGDGSNYSLVLPSVNISRPFLPPFPLPLPLPFPLPSWFDSEIQSFDLLASTRPIRREDSHYESAALMQESVQLEISRNQHKMLPLVSGVAEMRATNSNIVEHKANRLSIPRKSRYESRSSPSFSSFKVRKEKLGDRIAALQQLVAPFGKTDTASVLMEAIGYIKFLQDQVETLSVPYLRSSKNKKQRTSQEGSNEAKDEAKLDLRSRGLCLVPLSCTSYVTNENGGVWSPPNYRGNA